MKSRLRLLMFGETERLACCCLSVGCFVMQCLFFLVFAVELNKIKKIENMSTILGEKLEPRGIVGRLSGCHDFLS